MVYGWIFSLRVARQSIVQRHNLQPPESKDLMVIKQWLASEILMLQGENWPGGVLMEFCLVDNGKSLIGCHAIACTDRAVKELPRVPPSPAVYPKWSAWLKETGQDLTPKWYRFDDWYVVG